MANKVITIHDSIDIHYVSGEMNVFMDGILWFSMNDQKAIEQIAQSRKDSIMLEDIIWEAKGNLNGE